MNRTSQDLDQAVITLQSLLSKLRKVLVKLKAGSSQHTLAERRITAIEWSLELLERERRRYSSSKTSVPDAGAENRIDDQGSDLSV